MRIYFALNDIFICFQRQKVFDNTPADAGATLSWFDCCVRGLALIVHYVAPPHFHRLNRTLSAFLGICEMHQKSTVLETRAFPSVPAGFEAGSKVGICYPEAAAEVCIVGSLHAFCTRSILQDKKQELWWELLIVPAQVGQWYQPQRFNLD